MTNFKIISSLKLLIFFASCLLVFAPAVTVAQSPQLFTTQLGLTTSNIRNINVDDRGIVWVSGARSLDTFDGIEFHPVSLYDKEAKRYICTVVNSVEDIGEGRYLVHTNAGLYAYYLAEDRYQRILFDENEPDERGYDAGYSLPYINSGQLLVVTEGYGVFVLDTQTLDIDREESNKLHKSLRESFFHNAYIDDHNNMWADCHDYTFRLFSLTRKKFLKINITPEAQAELKLGAVQCIVESENRIFLALNSAVLVYDYSTNILSVANNSFPSTVDALLPVDSGKLMIGTDSHGFYEMEPDGSVHQYQLMTTPFNLKYAKVKCIRRLDDGTLVASLLQKGLLVIPPSSGDFTYHPISPERDGYNASCITSMANGWIATDGCGMFHLANPTDAPTLMNEGLNAKLMQAVLVDKHLTTWVASYGGGVQCFADGRFVTPDWLSNFTNAPVLSLSYNTADDILYIGNNGMGVIEADLTNHTLNRLHVITNAWISVTYFDDNASTLWAGTADGLYYYNAKTHKGGLFKYDQGLVADINCIRADKKHLYIGTTIGLFIVDKNKLDEPKSVRLLKDQRVMAMELVRSNLWVATSNSIVRIDDVGEISVNDIGDDEDAEVNCNSTVYRSFGGVFLGEFHRNSSMMTTSGRVLFGADNGVISFLPSRVSQSTRLNKRLIFTSITIGSQQPTASVPEDIYIESDGNAFKVTFCVPNLAMPERIRYQYRLKGIDNDWRECMDKPQAYYTGLDAGTYTFEVRAYDESDKDNYEEASLDIHVAAPWYASKLAWFIYLLLLGGLVYYLVHAYKLRRNQEKLIHQVREKEQMKEARLYLFTSITHELRSPLTMIVSPLRQLMSSDTDEKRRYLYDVMMRNSQRLLNIVKQITDIRQIDSGKLQLKFREVDFVSYLSNICDTYSAYATTNNVNFVVEQIVEKDRPSLKLWIDPIHFEKIIANLLSNAFKFTPEQGKIIVRYNIVDDHLELRFYNTGFDASKEDLSRFFERFYQGHNSDGHKGSGIGLNLVQELTLLHHGEISVHGVEPDGIEFVLTFPLGSAHLKQAELATSEDIAREEQDAQQSQAAALLDELPAEPQQNADEKSQTESSKKYTLLMVDDDTDLCQYVADQLAESYNVITANGGHSAWQVVLTARPDVVVTDIRMPDGDGLELCRCIKNNPETDNIPVIMLTSENDDEVMMQSLAHKADHFLSKPFNLMLLQGAITQALNVRENILRRTVRMDMTSGDYSAVSLTSADTKLFDRVKKSIMNHLDDSEYGVETMAEEVGISRVHLNRKMKEEYGVSPNVFIKTYRLKQAAYLLVHTGNVNVSEVAYTVGFSTAAYFSTSFRAHFGMTPKEFVAHYADHLDDETLQKLLQ